MLEFIAPGKNREATKKKYERIQKNVRMYVALQEVEALERERAIKRRIAHQKSIDEAQNAAKRTTKLYQDNYD